MKKILWLVALTSCTAVEYGRPVPTAAGPERVSYVVQVALPESRMSEQAIRTNLDSNWRFHGWGVCSSGYTVDQVTGDRVLISCPR
jgi:hypothetical protein